MNELRWFNVLRTLPSVFYTALLVVLVVSNRSLVVVTSLWVASQALAVAAIIIWLRRVRLRSSGEQPEVDRDEVLRYGAVGFVAQVSPVETFRLDQLFVAAFLPAHTLGLYVVAAGVSNLPRFVADAVSAIAFPTVASRLHNAHDARRLQMKYTLQCAAAAGLTTVVLMAVFPWLIPLLFGPSYSAAVEIAEVLVVASTVVAIRRVLSDCTRALGYAGIPTVGEVVSWVGLALGFALFGVSHGAIAVAAVLIGSALLAIATQVLLFERRAPRGGPPFGSAETALPVPE
jgi:O-antigen/teichoic acid export membrane protein